MAELKTKPSDADVKLFLQSIEQEKIRADSFSLLEIMQEATGQAPKIWGTNIIGFGSYHYQYESGRSGDWFPIGFSPKKQNITIYLTAAGKVLEPLLPKLGKYKMRGSCLYVKKLADVDISVLKDLIRQSYSQAMTRHHPK